MTKENLKLIRSNFDFDNLNARLEHMRKVSKVTGEENEVNAIIQNFKQVQDDYLDTNDDENFKQFFEIFQRDILGGNVKLARADIDNEVEREKQIQGRFLTEQKPVKQRKIKFKEPSTDFVKDIFDDIFHDLEDSESDVWWCLWC